ncbi:MAG: hypothetical protein AAB787_02695 [Patescibacteria group bacterium]
MDKDYRGLKKEAHRLRKDLGLSYNEIRKKLDSKVAKSTLSTWLKDVALKPKHKERLYTKRIEVLSRGSQSQKERRGREIDKIIEEAENQIKIPLSKETYRLMGAALYWAEGSKYNMFEITNSDPHLILFFVRWIEKIFGLPPKNLKARLNIYPQQNEISIKKFWSDLTGIPVGSFGKSYVKPISKGYKRNNLYYGTMRVEVPKSVNMKHRVFGWINAALRDINPEVNFVRTKWQSLKIEKKSVNLV